jgi:hypothetical protein
MSYIMTTQGCETPREKRDRLATELWLQTFAMRHSNNGVTTAAGDADEAAERFIAWSKKNTGDCA